MHLTLGGPLRLAVAVTAALVLPAVAVPATASAGPAGTPAAGTSVTTVVGGGTPAASLSSISGYWTADRMQKARMPKAPAGAKSGGAAPSGGPAGSTPPALPASGRITSSIVSATPTVGKVFFRDPADGYDYSCSATAINSNSKQMVQTAGHCVHGGAGRTWMQNWVFIPSYYYGSRPYGTSPRSSSARSVPGPTPATSTTTWPW